MFALLQRFWNWLTQPAEVENFRQQKAEIDRRLKELDEKIARWDRRMRRRL
jgi:hypothetical protein